MSANLKKMIVFLSLLEHCLPELLALNMNKTENKTGGYLGIVFSRISWLHTFMERKCCARWTNVEYFLGQ